MQKIDFSLVLPVHNQETIIRRAVLDILKVLNSLNISYEVILVENGSQDGTLKAVRILAKEHTGVRVITSKKGYGSAVIAGLNSARGVWVSYMPSDGQLNPRVLDKLYTLASTSMYTMVKIRRVTRESFLRKFQSFIFNLLTRQLYPISLTDVNGSPRIFKRNHLSKLDLHYKDSFIDCEMAIKAYYLGWQILEIPAKTLPRLGGKSTVSYKTVFEFIRNLFTYRFSKRLRIWRKKYEA